MDKNMRAWRITFCDGGLPVHSATICAKSEDDLISELAPAYFREHFSRLFNAVETANLNHII
jgi:hypothetical protein